MAGFHTQTSLTGPVEVDGHGEPPATARPREIRPRTSNATSVEPSRISVAAAASNVRPRSVRVKTVTGNVRQSGGSCGLQAKEVDAVYGTTLFTIRL